MVDTGQFGEVASGLFGSIFSSLLIFGGVLIAVGALLFIFWWKFIYPKKFDIFVKIISERSGDINKVYFDKAAILKDRKTGTKYFKLWNWKIELSVPPFGVLQTSNKGDYLELYRKGEEEIYFLNAARVDKANIIKSDGRKYPIANQEHLLLDAGDAYWNIKRKEETKKMFDKEKTVWKLLELAPHIISTVALIFILWIFMDKLPEILGQLERLAAQIKSTTAAEIKQGLILPFLFFKNKIFKNGT